MSAYITFIDYSKAFDSVVHSFLMDIMQTMGFPRHITSLIVSLYKNQKATIRCNGDNCEPFNIEKGVRQGCMLSSHLFNIDTEHIMRHADVESLGVNLGGGDITNLRYADDAALLSYNITSMKRILHRVDKAGQEAGLHLDAKKTKVMHLTISGGYQQVLTSDATVNSTKLENVGHFKYLGSYKTEDGKCSKYINARISQAKQNMVHLNNIWKDHSLPLQLKLKILKCLICPVMMYGCAAWTLIKADKKKIEAAEMWFYRRLLRVKWTEKRTNQSVLKEIGSPKQMLETINVRKLKYVAHIHRVDAECLAGQDPVSTKKGKTTNILH